MSRNRQWQHLYNRAAWRGPRGVRALKLRRDPICEVTGCRKPATHVDHRVKHNGDWTLFIGGVGTTENPMPNLRSLCQSHHDAKEEWAEKPGAPEWNPVSATGDKTGRQFLSSSVPCEQLNKALPQSQKELSDLLSGIPD